jgi:hypothetical protein
MRSPDIKIAANALETLRVFPVSVGLSELGPLTSHFFA